MDSISGRKLAQEIVELRKAVKDLAGSPQLGNSSFEAGKDKSIDELDATTGNVVGSFGTQFDGTHGAIPFVSPKPPMPTAPTVDSRPGILSAAWNGFFANEDGVQDDWIVAPLGLAYVEVHAAPAEQGPFFDAQTTDTLIATIQTARGAAITAAVPAQNYWVRLVARSTAGRASDPSVATLVTVPALVNTDQLEQDLATAREELDAAELRLDSAEGEIELAFQALDSVGDTADAALISANGKNRIYRSVSDPNIPAGHSYVFGDLWWKYADANFSLVIGEWTWNGTAWVSQKQGHQTIASVDVGALTVVGTATISNAVAERIAAGTAAIQQADIGNLTVTGTSTMASLVAEKIAAETGQYMYLTAQQIDVNQLWADLAFSNQARTHLLSVLTNDDGSGFTSTVSGQGLKVTYTVVDEFGAVVEVQDLIRLGTFGDDIFSISKAGIPVAAINSEGDISGKRLDVADTLTVGGEDVIKRINSMPQPIVAWGQVPITDNMSSNGEVGLFEIGWETNEPADAQRLYEFDLSPFLLTTTAVGNGVVGLRLRYTQNGDVPTINSSILGYYYVVPGLNGSTTTVSIKRIIGSNNGPYIRVLVSLYDSTSGVATVYNGAGQTHLFCTVKDLGVTTPPTATPTTGGGTPWTGTTTTAPAVPKVTKTAEWGYTEVRSYTGSNAHYAYNHPKAYQGLSPAGYGNLKSIWTFPSLTSTLSGATINDIWVYVYFEHWYANAGGTARIRLHGNASLPATYNGTGFGVNSGGWPRASGRWVRLSDSLYSGFQSGTYKGFGLEGDSTYGTYGIANNARLRIRYTK